MPQFLFLDFPIISVKTLAIAENGNPVFDYRYIWYARQLFIVLLVSDTLVPEGEL